MANTTHRPIGFGREKDSDPNGTGDGFQWQPGDAAPEPPADQPPARAPKAAPAYVGTGETLAILAAYDLFPLTPLSNLEQQLVQVVAGLEKRLEEFL